MVHSFIWPLGRKIKKMFTDSLRERERGVTHSLICPLVLRKDIAVL